MGHNWSVAARLAAVYGAFSLVIGGHMPYWPVWLEARGMDARDIGVILAAGLLLRVFVGPLIAFAADRYSEHRLTVILLAGAATASFSLFALAYEFWAILGVSLLWAVFFPSLIPLVESITLHTTVARGLDYGRIRLWGSITFIVANVACGALLARMGVDVVFLWVVAAGTVTLIAAFLLPRADAGAVAPRAAPFRMSNLTVIGRLLFHPLFALLMVGGAIIQASHAVYYAFGTITWQRAGYDETLIGALWATGVVAEIVLFLFSGRVMAWLGPGRLLLIAGIGGIVRWSVTALMPALPVLFMMQSLHALTFGAAHLATMQFIVRAVPPSLSATAQSLYAALSAGVVIGAATYASGFAYAAMGPAAYGLMALLGAAGAVAGLSLARRWDGKLIEVDQGASAG